MAEQIARYVVYEPIATGGMATVHLARMIGPLGFSRTLAVKRLHKHLAGDAEFSVMLLDEARITARIQHPCVVQTLDVVHTDGELLIVMEYVHGQSLARLLKAGRALGEVVDPAMAATVMLSILSGLHAAHEATDEEGEPLHVVHRDVSPHNVLVGVDGVAKVLDFGVAKALGRAQTTRSGQLKGKLAYMSPEQLSSGVVDRRTDVFAASVVFWEMLTGQRLFFGDDEKVTIGRVLQCVVPKPSSIREGIAPELDAIVQKGLARSPEDRFATARDMARAIEESLPMVTPSKISAWVERLFADELSERRKLIAALERSAPPPTNGSFVASAGEATKSAQSVSVNVVEPPARPSRWPLVAALVVLFSGGAWWALRTRASSPLERIASSTTTTTSASSSPSIAATTLTATSAPSPSTGLTVSAANATASAIAHAGTPSTIGPSLHKPTAQPSASTKVAPPVATLDCTNPYVLDAEGHKRYRRECLGP